MTTNPKKKTKTALLVFILTVFIGLLSIIISFNSQKLMPGIFEGEIYKTPDPGCENPDAQGCCDDHKDSTPSPSPKTSSSPGVSPSPSSSPGTLSCTGLTPQPNNPKPGEIITFICSTQYSSAPSKVNFRVLDKDGNIINSQTEALPVREGLPDGMTESNSFEFSFTVPESGSPLKAQCQFCNRIDICTQWGQAN